MRRSEFVILVLMTLLEMFIGGRIMFLTRNVRLGMTRKRLYRYSWAFLKNRSVLHPVVPQNRHVLDFSRVDDGSSTGVFNTCFSVNHSCSGAVRRIAFASGKVSVAHNNLLLFANAPKTITKFLFFRLFFR